MGFWRDEEEDEGVFEEVPVEPPTGPCPRGGDHDWGYIGGTHNASCGKCGESWTF
jgi:hypothetical protein